MIDLTLDYIKERELLLKEIEQLREQAHYHYENGLKKDVEIDWLREEVTWYSPDPLRWEAPYVKDDPRVSAIIKAALKEKE